MATEQQEPKQQSLFPTRDSLQEVMDEGLAALPIINPNQLIALLQLHHNTLLNLMDHRSIA